MSRKGKHNPHQRVATQQAQLLAVNHHQQFSGPLPPPSLLKEYDLTLPGLAERVVCMAENEQDQRHARESEINNANIEIAHENQRSIRRGQWMAFCIAMSGMGLSGLLVWNDFAVAGTLLGGGFLATLVAAFLKTQQK